MKSFNIKRFVSLFRYTLIYNKSMLVRIALGYFIFFSVIYLLTSGLIFSTDEVDRLDAAEGITYGVFVGFIIFMPSWIIGNMSNKQETIDYLMLPASTLEKYLARFLCVTVCSTVSCLVAIIGADIFQWIISLTRYPLSETASVVYSILAHGDATVQVFGPVYVDYGLLTALVYVMFIWLHSLYTVGGMLFRKKMAWVFSSLLFLFIVMIVSYTISELVSDGIFEWMTLNNDIVMIIALIIFSGFAALNYWMSYILFKRMQLINNRWINL